jgi:hypothetical protein
MQVQLTNLDGRSLGQAVLTRCADGHLVLDGVPVLAVRIIGSRTALILGDRQVCVATYNYAQALLHPPEAGAALVGGAGG